MDTTASFVGKKMLTNEMCIHAISPHLLMQQRNKKSIFSCPEHSRHLVIGRAVVGHGGLRKSDLYSMKLLLRLTFHSTCDSSDSSDSRDSSDSGDSRNSGDSSDSSEKEL